MAAKRARRFFLRDSYSGARSEVKKVFALFDAKGEFYDAYSSPEKAKHDAVGPRFRPRSTIVPLSFGKQTEIEGG